jgi:hypothetical protein
LLPSTFDEPLVAGLGTVWADFAAGTDAAGGTVAVGCAGDGLDAGGFDAGVPDEQPNMLNAKHATTQIDRLTG